VFLCNSGTEANEAALKVVRRARTGRSRIVAAEGGFHGRTLGALSITGQPAKRAPFAPLLPDVTFVPYGDVEALTAAVTDETAAVFLEPVQGEAGVIPAPMGYLEAAREACDATGALLVLDEVQGGVGRAGAWFSHEVTAPTVTADVITMAKGLGGGLPIGACIARGEAGNALQPGDHGATFGGNAVACAAALATLGVIESEKLMVAATERGDQLVAALRHDLIDHIRGVGLWRGVVLKYPVAKEVENAARRHGVLINAVAPNVFRLAPALVITEAEIDAGAAAVLTALEEAKP
jgi:acetylornithine aminotransferase